MDGHGIPTKFLLSREIPYLSIPIPPLQIKQRLHVRHAASAQRGITSRLPTSECTEITTTRHSYICSIPSSSLAHEIYPNAEHQQQRQKQTNKSRKQQEKTGKSLYRNLQDINTRTIPQYRKSIKRKRQAI